MRTLWALPLFWFLLAALVAYDSRVYPPQVAVFGFGISAVLVAVACFSALRFWRPLPEATPAGDSDVWESFPTLPRELDHWNWGAFFYGPAWAIGNRVWWGAFAALPYVGLPIAVYLGFRGNRLAWVSTKWSSVHEFIESQRAWTRWAAGAFAGAVLALLVLPVIAVIAV